jgi:uncharacterized protein
MRVLITGGTGQVGRRLSPALAAAGHDVVVLTRDPSRQVISLAPGVRAERWDARTAGDWGRLVDADTAIINLAGENLMAGRWTAALKREVLDSRVNASRTVADAIERAPAKPRVLLQASAIGVYGDRGDEELTEDSPPGTGWMADVCRTWEAATDGVPLRRIVLRVGVVLDPAGGGLVELRRAARLRVARLGSGRQWVAWIGHADVVAAVTFLLDHASAEGPFNLVGPAPARNAEMLAAVAQARGGGRPILPVPTAVLRVTLGEKADAVLMSQRVLPRRLLELGFAFRHPTLDAALRDA